MAFEVSLSPRAIADAENAYLWLKEQNPEFANKWFQGLSDALISLERKSKKTTFRILFGISDNEVFVYRIRHASQQYLTEEEL